MKTHTHTRCIYTIPGTEIEVELPHTPDCIMEYKEPLVKITDDEIILGYLVHDNDCEDPLKNDDDYMGHIYEARRHGSTLREYERVLGLGDFEGEPRNPYAVMLDVYEHGGIAYSLSGQGTQCRFDTTRGGAVWVPSEALVPDIEEHKDPQARARELAKQAAEQYTDWRNGNCFGVVIATYEKVIGRVLAPLNEDACGGYIGGDYAYEALKETFSEETRHAHRV